MKIGAELVAAIQPIAGLLSQSLDQNSQFYRFLESNSQHKPFLQQLTAEMQSALRFKGPGRYTDKNGLSKNLFAEYLEAILELNAGNATRLIELFQQSIAQNIVALFNKHLIALTALNDEFVGFEKRLQSPSVSVAASSSHASTSAPSQAFSDLIDAHSGKPLAELSLDQSFYIPSTSGHATVSATSQAFGDLIDASSGKRLAELSMDQSFYVPSTSGHATASATSQSLNDLMDLFSGKPIVDLAADQSFYVASTSRSTYTPARTHELQRASSIPHGYRLTGKYGQPVSELDCNQSIRMLPVRN